MTAVDEGLVKPDWELRRLIGATHLPLNKSCRPFRKPTKGGSRFSVAIKIYEVTSA
jgi:hypothetical protein